MIENHVTSLELSKLLKELGFSQRSEFWWIKPSSSAKYFIVDKDNMERRDRYTLEMPYSAYLASELGEWLPKATGGKKENVWVDTHKNTDGSWTVRYMSTEKGILQAILPINENPTECNQRARMLIWLAKQKLIDVSKLEGK